MFYQVQDNFQAITKNLN